MPLAVLTSLCLCVTLLLAALLSLCIYNAVTAVRLHQQVLRADDDPAAPLCSLLIPARDEEDNLRRHLPRLLALRGARVEVLILDDHSRDGTARVAAAFARGAPFPVRVLSGAPLPPGWLGKNWACHQLSQAARGELDSWAGTTRGALALALEGVPRGGRVALLTFRPLAQLLERVWNGAARDAGEVVDPEALELLAQPRVWQALQPHVDACRP